VDSVKFSSELCQVKMRRPHPCVNGTSVAAIENLFLDHWWGPTFLVVPAAASN